MISLFRNRTFTKLFLAAFASQLGTVVGNMAFAYYLVDRYSERPALATTAELMYSLPTLAVFWFVGVIADRIDRKFIDCASFLLSGLLIAKGDFPEHARMPNGRNRIRDIRIPLLLKDFWLGLRYIMGNRLLLVLISGFLFFGIVNGVFAILPIFSMKYKISPDNYVVHSSLTTIFLGAGFLIGSVIGLKLIRRYTRIPILIAGLFISSVLIGGLGFTDRIEVYLLLVFIEGIAIAPINIALGSWMPELVPPQNMGRVNALIEPVMMLGHSLALGFVALAFPAWVSITWLHYLLGICTLGVSFYYLLALPPLVRKRASQAHEQEQKPNPTASHS
ncbi:MFS transporter [Paenibacillus sp. FSL W8-0186]|uniref:MFS transporter n=1 Tax=Paenibacillus sp. FSL W8-0186 TaxID=2921709 RepID=UPI0030D371F1